MKHREPVDNPRITGAYSSKHTGIDYGHPDSTPVFATESGTVTVAKNTETRNWIANSDSDPYKPTEGTRKLRTEDYGNYIIIKHLDGYETLYAHLKKDSLQVQVNQFVPKGTFIARVGSTGNSTGNHLHYEQRKDGKTIKPTFEEVPMADTAELERLRKEADDARKARDENWTRGEEFRVKLEEANAIIKNLDEVQQRLVLQIDEVRITARKKEEADAVVIQTLTEKLSNQTTPEGALPLLTLALKSALAGRWT